MSNAYHRANLILKIVLLQVTFVFITNYLLILHFTFFLTRWVGRHVPSATLVLTAPPMRRHLFQEERPEGAAPDGGWRQPVQGAPRLGGR